MKGIMKMADNKINELINHGKQSGKLTTKEITDVLEELDFDADEINRLYSEEHQHPYHAVLNATVSRVRPVIMASLTTILGMLPLVVDPMYSSMAITIMGGLTVGTLITLVLLPLFYTALFHVTKPVDEK